MAKSGPKSVASLSVATLNTDVRPLAPKSLTRFQKELWTRITLSETARLFKTAASQDLLGNYVKHAESVGLLASAIDAFEPGWLKDDEGIDRYDRLLRMRDREVKATTSLATKMRLTPQSRYTPGAAATAAAGVKSGRPPWDFPGRETPI